MGRWAGLLDTPYPLSIIAKRGEFAVEHQVKEILDDLRFIQDRFFTRSTEELVLLADRRQAG